MAFFILTRFVLVKYSRALVERTSQGTSSLVSRLTTVSLDYILHDPTKLFDAWLHWVIMTTCISYNMGMSALPDMYARSPRAEGIHIRQSMRSAHVITNMLHFWHS